MADVENQELQFGRTLPDLTQQLTERISRGTARAQKVAAQAIGRAVVGNAVYTDIRDECVAWARDHPPKAIFQRSNALGGL